METLPRGARATCTPPKCSSTSSAPAAPSQASETTVNEVHHSHRHWAGGVRKEHDSLWRKIVNEPEAFPPEFWQLFLQSSLTALGGKCQPVCVGLTWRRLIAAGAMRQWRPRLDEVNREVRQFWVAVPGGVERMGLRASTLHETGNWLVLTDYSNAFNTVKRTAVLAEAPTACQRSRCFGPSVMAQDPLACSFGWTQGRPGRSPAPAVSSSCLLYTSPSPRD